MADVAHEAGVSVASVSNFLNKQPYMSEAMAARIAEAIDRLGYKVNSSARNLRSGRTRLLKLVIPDLRQVYFSELAEDILAEARQHGYGVIVESTTNNRARELESIASMGTHSADGLILSPLMMTVDDIAALDGDYPLVLLGERLFGVNAPHVVIRNREGAAAATYHLLDAGCRRIAVVGAVPHPEHDFSSGSIRTHGYREALAARGIPCDDSLLIETQGWGSADGLVAVDTMLESGLQFDAVFALNDLLACCVNCANAALPCRMMFALSASMTWRNRPTWCRLFPPLTPAGKPSPDWPSNPSSNRSNPAAVPPPKPSRPPIASPCASPHRRWRAPDESVVRNIRSE